jgi:hypothetical protein
MTDMDVAIGIRRAVVQNKFWAACGVRTQLLVKLAAFPRCQHSRFALSKITAHGEIRGWQVKGVLIIRHHSILLSSSGLLRCLKRRRIASFALKTDTLPSD